MRQLKVTNTDGTHKVILGFEITGWMSDRGRQIAANFFIWKLGLDWRLGAA